jgi:hypothetical protein
MSNFVQATEYEVYMHAKFECLDIFLSMARDRSLATAPPQSATGVVTTPGAHSAALAGTGRLGHCATGPGRRPKAVGHSALKNIRINFKNKLKNP